jgi:hypothetical protein
VEPLDGDEAHVGQACERRSARAKCGWAARSVDSPAGGGSGSQPAVRLCHQFHSPPRARLRSTGEPLHARAVPPLRGGVAQLRPNAISQVATFVSVCEGFLGIPANWDLWVHLFRTEQHTLTTPEPQVRRAVRTGSKTISLRESRREFYIPYTMTSNNTEWERGWFYLRNDESGLPPTPARF